MRLCGPWISKLSEPEKSVVEERELLGRKSMMPSAEVE